MVGIQTFSHVSLPDFTEVHVLIKVKFEYRRLTLLVTFCYLFTILDKYQVSYNAAEHGVHLFDEGAKMQQALPRSELLPI